MCGIFGYAGKEDAAERIIHGLKRLEYRGYDSWGIAVIKEENSMNSKNSENSKSGNNIVIFKKVGAIGDNLPASNSNSINQRQAGKIENEKLLGSNIGIGHTRWATHGGVTEINAHPQLSTDGSFALAQNGIVENYQELKKSLIEKGYKFISQTDTEVIVRLIEDKLNLVKDLREATRLAFLDLRGRNTIILLEASKEHIIAVRNGSPLVVGISPARHKKGRNLSEWADRKSEIFIASDTLSFADRTNQIALIENNQLVEYLSGELKLYNVKDNNQIALNISELDHADVEVDKEGFEHFMIKEIVEQKYTIKEAIQYSLEELMPLLDQIKKSRKVYTVGAGTAGFAAQQIAYMLRKHATINATELKAYEMESYRELFTENDLIIAVSQSGETADTIEALEFAKENGTKIASIVNMLGSTITRISDYPYFTRSGPEICVASTKAFTAQISWGLLVSLSLIGKYEEAKKTVDSLSEKLQNYFNDDLFNQLKDLAKQLKDREHFFVLGKGRNYVTALEGALKIKEITYKHFEGFPAGELKHGVIALIERGTPVFGIISEDENKTDLLSALAEVKSRGAFTIAVAKEDNELFDFFIKAEEGKIADTIANIIPFQLISYFLALELGNSPDRPRNLAKSVTVK